MLKNNKEFQLNYLTCLQNTFIENMKEDECVELLREINSLDVPSLQMSRSDYRYGINIEKIIVQKGIKEVPYITKAEDYMDNEEYESKIGSYLYYFKINFFAKKGNDDANDILNKLVKEFPYNVISGKIHLNLNLSEIENKGQASEIFVKHKKLYELFLNYENVNTPLSYDKLADYWNDNTDYWNKYFHQNRNPHDGTLFGSKKIDAAKWQMFEDRCIQSIQKYIGEAIYLDFMASPSKHLEFAKRMPELLDLYDWFKESYAVHLHPFLEQEHIDVMARMGTNEEKKLFIDSIFDIAPYVSDTDMETGFVIKKGSLNPILHLIDKGVNFNPMFGSKYDSLAPNVSLAEFYSNKKDERTEKIRKSLAENIELMEQRIGTYILNNSLQKGLQVNEQKQKNRVKI